MYTPVSEREAVVQEAISWVGTPFHFGSAVKGVGVACGPFLLCVHCAWNPHRSAAGLTNLQPLAKDWHFHTKQERFLEQVQQFCRKVDVPEPGDIVLFRLGAKDRPYSHGAIVVDWPAKAIHAHFRSGVEWVNPTTDKLLKSASEISFWSPRELRRQG